MSENQLRSQTTVAQLLAQAFAANKVERIFGVPGGGSSLDIIEAAADVGIEFVLTRTESAAVMMAAATAELSGTLGVALTTKGPGTANAANGVAYASLDRAPVVLISDGFEPGELSYVTHQAFDQRALLAPVTKGSSCLESEAIDAELGALIHLARTPPLGPVHIELTGAGVRTTPSASADLARAVAGPGVDEAALAEAEKLVANAVTPVVVVGLEARATGVAEAIGSLIARLNCPTLVTYKAKGVVADQAPQYVGVFTGGAAEADCLSRADLILFCGIDPVEFIRKPWRYGAPVIDIAAARHPVHYLEPTVGLYGPIAQHIGQLGMTGPSTAWSETQIEELRHSMQGRLQYPSGQGLGPQQVVEIAVEESASLSAMPRITVDAGAHMLSVMAFWPCTTPYDVLISNGLATMAFALPAAIAAALHEPTRPVVAFTGDGGLLMCLGELSTAVEQQARIVVIVFNDQSLSMIDIKQQQKGQATRGVRWARPDFAQTMVALGGQGYLVDNVDDYRRALTQALTVDGPVLIDVSIDSSGYPDQLKALRG